MFSRPAAREIDRMVFFRDHLRADAADRDRYAQTKVELAQREWKYVQNYADAKSAVIDETLARPRATYPPLKA